MKTKKAIKRIRTNVTLPPILYQKVKDYDLNLSAFLQIKLVEYFTYIEGSVPQPQMMHPYTPTAHYGVATKQGKSGGKTSNQQIGCGYRDSNPGDWLGKPIS